MTGCRDGMVFFSQWSLPFLRSTIATWERCVMWWPIEGPGSHGPFKGWKGKLWEVAPRWLHVEHLRAKKQEKVHRWYNYVCLFCISLIFVCRFCMFTPYKLDQDISKIHRCSGVFGHWLFVWCMFQGFVGVFLEPGHVHFCLWICCLLKLRCTFLLWPHAAFCSISSHRWTWTKEITVSNSMRK